MKSNSTLFALLLALAATASAQISFEQHFGTPSRFDAFSAIAHTNDGGYLLAGSTANFGSEELDILLIKTDAAGNALWTKTWGGPGDDGATALAAAGGSGYLLAGYTAGINGDRDFLALRLDDNGEEIWHFVHGSSDDDVAEDVLLLSDGGFLVTGTTIPVPFSDQEVFAVRIADNGTVSWEKQYGNVGSNYSKGAVETSDGGFILVTDFKTLLKVNAQGSVSWQKMLNFPDGFPIIEFIQRDQGGQIIVGGGNLTDDVPFFVSLNEDGNIETNFNVQSDSAFASLWISDAKRLLNGHYALMFRGFYAPDFVPSRPGLALFDPVADTVLWYSTNEEMNLADIWQPGQLMTTTIGDDILLVGSTLSNEEGANAVFSKFTNTGVPLWRKSFGVAALADNENGQQVLQTSDGGYLVLANKIVSGNSLDMWLIKTDANGSVQWDVAYGFPDADNLAGLDATPDGGYIAAGYNDSTIRVLKVNDAGQLQWLKKFTVPLFLYQGAFGVQVSPNNETLLILFANDQLDNDFGVLMKLNAQGDSLWAKYYSNLGAGYTQPALYNLAFTSDNRYALCGSAIILPDNKLWPVIALTDLEGNLLWSKTYDPDDALAILLDIHMTSDNGFIANGARFDDTTYTIRPYVIRTDANGNLLWTAKPDDPAADYLVSWASAHQADSENTFLFEQKRYTPDNKPTLPERDYVGSVQKLNAAGQLLCEQNFGFGRTASFFGGTATSDGGAVAVGTATFDNSTDAWLVKMTSNCTVGFQTPLVPPFGMQLSPNPSRGELVLEITSEHVGTVTVKVVNVAGQEVLQWQGEKNGEMLRQNFDLSRVADGVYFVWVQIDEKARALSWVKQN